MSFLTLCSLLCSFLHCRQKCATNKFIKTTTLNNELVRIDCRIAVEARCCFGMRMRTYTRHSVCQKSQTWSEPMQHVRNRLHAQTDRNEHALIHAEHDRSAQMKMS